MPHIKIYKISSNARTRLTATYEQLYPAVWSRSSASPAVIRERMEGMISKLRIAWRNSSLTALSNLHLVFSLR